MGGDAISYTDIDVDEAINDFSNGFIDEISLSKTTTYAAKLLVFEKAIEHQRDDAFAILQGRDEFVMKPTRSEKIIDLPNDLFGIRLHESSFWKGNST